MSKLTISEQFSLPGDAVTQTFAILGIRGAGKTNTAVVLFEEMVKQDDQCVVLDPTDAWYGVRSGRDGKSAGLPVYVFGGEHGDLPLEGNNGAQMADFVIESGASVIFSLRHLTMADQRRFAADFGERLRFLKARPENRNPIHIFLDEAEEFIPQNIRESDPNTARMFGAYNRMVRRDRNIGLGLTLISQRPQSVNKEPLSQVETLICHRLLHKLDRKSVKESWVDGHDSEGRAEEFLNSLASLEKGDVWIWSPYWLNIFKQAHIRYRETFDSSATPKPGERAKVAKVRATVDLDVLRQKLSESIDKAKNSDPTYLKRRIMELEKGLKDRPLVAAAPSSAELDKAYEAGRKDLLAQNANAKTKLQRDAEKLSHAASNLKFQEIPDFFAKVFARMREIADLIPSDQTKPSNNAAFARLVLPATAITKPRTELQRPSHVNGDSELAGPERKILRALGELRSIGKDSPRKTMVAAWAGYSPIGGAFGNPIGALRTKGLIDYPQPGFVSLTDAGRTIVGECEAPGQEEIWRRIENTCTGPEQKILRALLDNAGSNEITKNELAEKAGYSPIGGAFGNPIGALRTKGLLDYPRPGSREGRRLVVPVKSRNRPRPFRTRSRLGTKEFLDHGFHDPRSHIVTRTGRVVLRGQDKTDLRRRVYRRAGGRCEIEWAGKRCNKFAPWDGFKHGELVHKIDSAHGGSDTEENTEWGCPDCHTRRDHPGLQFHKRTRDIRPGEDSEGRRLGFMVSVSDVDFLVRILGRVAP